jgi:hypothetical protein
MGVFIDAEFRNDRTSSVNRSEKSSIAVTISFLRISHIILRDGEDFNFVTADRGQRR